MTITGGEIKDNIAQQGYGGIGNAGHLILKDVTVTANEAGRRGGGLGNNTGTVVIQGIPISGNTSGDEYDNIWTNPEDAVTGDAVTWHNTIFVPTGLNIVASAPTYEISTPKDNELFAKSLTYWEFSASTFSSSAIRDWEINWGDGSKPTEILGGPRSRINVTHYFREPGTYTITLKTTDFDGVISTVTIGTYTIKERAAESMVESSPAEDFASVESDIAEFSFEPELVTVEQDTMEFLSPAEPVVSFTAPVQFTSESRFSFTDSYLAGLAETMRQRQMLDLDQSGSFGQKSDSVSFADLVWADDDLFGDEWLDFSEQKDESDFWDDVFESDLSLLKSGLP
jgi:hypothetical protein